MPLYTLKCDECKYEFDHYMDLAELDEFKKNNIMVKCSQCSSEQTQLKVTATRTKHKSWFTWTL